MLVCAKLFWKPAWKPIDEAEYLLKYGADVNIRTNHGFSCLFSAIEMRRKKFFWLFLKYGAQIESDRAALSYATTLNDKYFINNLNLLRTKIIFCSVKHVSRVAKKSKLLLMPVDIIRKLFTEFLYIF